MTYDEINEILDTGDSESWARVEEGNCTYKNDPLLTIVPYGEPRDFNEEWATNHADSKAQTSEYEVRYGGSVICRKMLVSVDGGRAILPMPLRNTTTIPRSEYNFARIVSQDRLDEYIQRSNLTVGDS